MVIFQFISWLIAKWLSTVSDAPSAQYFVKIERTFVVPYVLDGWWIYYFASLAFRAYLALEDIDII